MKKIFLGITLLAAVGFTTVSCNNDDDNNNVSYVELNTLPTAAIDFVNAYFPGMEIFNIEKYSPAKANDVMYEVNFKNGTEIEFDSAGNWVKVEADGNATIPTSFILPAIVNYVTTNYANQGINQIERMPNGFDVELTNDIDLIFDTTGQFVRIKP